MTPAQAQSILEEAQRLHGESWLVDENIVGAVYQEGLTRIVRIEVWLAMRAIMIGRALGRG